MLWKGLVVMVVSAALKVGDRAPDFVAKDTEGRSLHLFQMLTDGPVVLTFYPKAFTSGCTRQMTNYGKIQEVFAQMGAQVVAVSADDEDTQRRFKDKTGAHATYFVADPDGKIIRLYDIKTPMVTIAKRRTFVIGQDGLIKSIETGDDAIDARSTADIVSHSCGR